MPILKLNLKQEKPRQVDIVVQKGMLRNIPKLLAAKKYGFRYAIITDVKVKKLFGDELAKNMEKSGLKTSIIAITPGENSKTVKTVGDIAEKMAAQGLKRDCCVIALGGGVVGDLAGFCASIYMRGVPLIHIPTTLLSMVDSCLGGKTGADLSSGKNLIGTFYDPQAIFIDPEILSSLPSSEFRSGLAEIIKQAVIGSPALFKTLEQNANRLTQKSYSLLEKIILENLKVKKKLVEADQRENLGKTKSSRPSRMFLNYGHTIGHGIEKVTNYQISHGQAVAIGMCLENIIAVKKKFLSKQTALRIKELIKIYGLKTSLPSSVSLKELDRALKSDKKTVGGKIYFAIPERIGKMRLFTL